MKTLRNTLALARSSWAVLQADRELLVLPLLSGIASAIVAGSFLVPLVLVSGGGEQMNAASYVLLFAMYLVLALITIFFNSALVSGAYERLQGGDPTLSSALHGATARLGSILPWAVVAATVSFVLRMVQERGGAVGRVAAGLTGVGWSLVTFLVIPVIVVEGLDVKRAIKRSSGLFKQTWGENVAAQVGFGALGFLLAIPGILVAVAGAALGSVGLVIGIAVGVLWILVVTLVMAALNGIFQTALYLYATERDVAGGYFTPGQFDAAFATKGTAAL
jgi:hypothetical protein